MEEWKKFLELFNAVILAVQASTPLLLFVAGLAIGKMLKKSGRVGTDSIPIILGCIGFILGGILLPARYTMVEMIKGELFGMSLMWASVGLHQSMKGCIAVSLVPRSEEASKPSTPAPPLPPVPPTVPIPPTPPKP